MRFHRSSVLAVAALRLTYGLVLPELGTSSTLKTRDSSSEFGEIVARQFTCDIRKQPQCVSCPDPEVKLGKCPPGGICGRSSDTNSETSGGSLLKARVPIPFDKIKSGTWGPGKIIETAGLSVCSVMAVYDENKWVMAHIPPARASGSVLIATGEEVIQAYKESMTTKYNDAQMQNPLGYLLISTWLDEGLRQSMRQWFLDNNVAFTEKIYSPEDVISGSGNLAISREAHNWPPTVSLL